MLVRRAFGVTIMLFVLLQMGHAGTNEDLQKFFYNASVEVQATDDPAEKREILENSFESMIDALNRVQNSPFVASHEKSGIVHLKATVQDYLNELTGVDGYEQVPDEQLNDFSEYVVQDMEQARRYVTIGVGTAILIAVLLLML